MSRYRSRAVVVPLVLSLGMTACTAARGGDEAALSGPTVTGVKVGSPVTVVAAGDIADNPDDGRATARLIQSIRPDAVLTLGDNAYPDGTLAEYRRNYDPTWGRFRSITRPVPGNHEYGTPGAAGYLAYFDGQVHGRSYYAWNAGHWRLYALNCEIACGEGSEQLAWLRRDLDRHSDRPALAYVHKPRFTCSTRHPPLVALSAVWAALQRARGRVLLSGHNHAYERFAEQDSTGRPSADGLRQFVVGTGGVALYPLEPSCPNRLAAQDDSAGVLVLKLGPADFSWQFIAVDGDVLDQGRGRA